MTTSQTYCKLSHVSLAIQNKGDACVCNKNTSSFTDSHGNLKFLYNTGLKEIWDLDSRKSISIRLDNGERVDGCQSCWNDEAAGVKSSRQSFNKQLINVDPMDEQPRVLIIKPSNVCNLSCRTCQPVTSSGLYQDFYKLETEQNTFSGTFKEYTSQFETIRDGFGQDNVAVWDTFEQWIPGLTFLDIYGGEPMLAPAMWERMISAGNAGTTSNTDAQMHTNGTIWNQDYIDCLHKFKSFNIGLSIDAARPDQLSYIRNGVDINRLTENIGKYIKLTKTHSNVTAYICLTVSIFNIWYIDEIIDELGKYGLQIGVNVVDAPEQYDFRHLPGEVKNTLIEKFNNYKGNYPIQMSNLVNLLKHNIPRCNILFPKFWYELIALDKIRNQKFKDVMPEYYNAITTAQPWLLDIK
jgi:hypothetical protein